MNAMYFQSTGAAANGVESLENQLKLSLRPVRPNPDFVDHLHDRLTTPVSTTLEHRQNAAFSLLLVACSLVSGIFVVWLMHHLREESPLAEP